MSKSKIIAGVSAAGAFLATEIGETLHDKSKAQCVTKCYSVFEEKEIKNPHPVEAKETALYEKSKQSIYHISGRPVYRNQDGTFCMLVTTLNS